MRRRHACAAALALCLSYSEAVDCVAAGFAPSLRCGSCATLEALVPDEDIVKDCRSCCADDGVVLELSLADLEPRLDVRDFVVVAGFVENKASEYDKLEVVYRQGQKPRLVLVDEEGDVGETLPIGGWTEDTIVEYLADTIGAAASAKDEL